MINNNLQIGGNKITLIKSLGFKISDSSNSKYTKYYTDGSNIIVDFSKRVITFQTISVLIGVLYVISQKKRTLLY